MSEESYTELLQYSRSYRPKFAALYCLPPVSTGVHFKTMNNGGWKVPYFVALVALQFRKKIKSQRFGDRKFAKWKLAYKPIINSSILRRCRDFFCLHFHLNIIITGTVKSSRVFDKADVVNLDWGCQKTKWHVVGRHWRSRRLRKTHPNELSDALLKLIGMLLTLISITRTFFSDFFFHIFYIFAFRQTCEKKFLEKLRGCQTLYKYRSD